MKNHLSPQSNVVRKALGFSQQILVRFNIDIEGKGENLELKELSHLINLLDFQLLPTQVLPGVVGKF